MPHRVTTSKTSNLNVYFSYIQTVLEILNENDIHLRELSNMINHLHPQVFEITNEFEQIRTKQEQLYIEVKVRHYQSFFLFSNSISLKDTGKSISIRIHFFKTMD